ncbi:hypothetical protein D3C72_1365160 [compost metagenome]
MPPPAAMTPLALVEKAAMSSIAAMLVAIAAPARSAFSRPAEVVLTALKLSLRLWKLSAPEQPAAASEAAIRAEATTV